MHYSFTEENYLKAIFKLSEQNSESVNTNSIAELLQTKAASVTDMLKKLAEKGLIAYKKYQGVTLSDKGRKVAIGIIRKHRLWEVFLHEKLLFSWDVIHDMAEQLEHIQSELLVDKLEEFLGFPTHDPHGDPIPTKSGKIRKDDFIPLFEIEAGQKGILSGVKDHTNLFLQYLDRVGLKLGKPITLKEKNEYDGSMLILVNETEFTISREVAKNILITRL